MAIDCVLCYRWLQTEVLMRYLATLASVVLMVLLLPAGMAQNEVEVKDLRDRPFKTDFPSGGRLRIHLRSGDFQIVGHDADTISIRFDGKNADQAKDLTVHLKRANNHADLRVFGGPKNGVQVTIEVPKSTDLYVRMPGGDLNVKRIVGDKDVELTGGDLTIGTGHPADYAHVDASVRFGDLHSDVFGPAKGWLGGSLKKNGAGRYTLHAHVFAGDLTLRME